MDSFGRTNGSAPRHKEENLRLTDDLENGTTENSTFTTITWA